MPKQPDVSVVICSYTEARWDDLAAAVESVRGQEVQPLEVIVVSDHNERLLERARADLPGVIATPNLQRAGLSGARNTGIEAARGEFIAFLDDDAFAAHDWLGRLRACYDDDRVLGAGGAAMPLWAGERPAWFPDEFAWVVGCAYRGLPDSVAPVRNLIGCNMSFRRAVFQTVGGFQHSLGRIAGVPAGCEETELCIRARRHWKDGVVLYEPAALVYHRVPASRATWRYFRDRCHAEGMSKAVVTRLVGTESGLSSERSYTLRVLPSGAAQGLREALLRRHPAGAARAAAIVSGFAVTTAGYLKGHLLARHSGEVRSPEALANDAKVVGMTPSHPVHPVPVNVLEVELSAALPDVGRGGGGAEATRSMTLVRLHGTPLGILTLDESHRDSSSRAAAIWEALGSQIAAHLDKDGLSPATELGPHGLPLAPDTCHATRNGHAVPITAVIATHDRPATLRRCLLAVLAQDYPDFRVVVVDNAPSSDAAAQLVREEFADTGKVRYVRADVPGLAIAHNRGLQEVDTPIVAFTDDDVLVDRGWLAAINRAFQSDDQIACVTGLIFPTELDTQAQVWAEAYWGFRKGFAARLFDLGEHRVDSPLYPYTAGMFGSGANMAFRTAALHEMGGFDPALGTGTRAKGGDDLAAFFETIKRGHRIAYEPCAVVYHPHHREYAGFLKQAHGYGAGLTAYLTKVVMDRPWLLLDVARRLPQGMAYLLGPGSMKNKRRPRGFPAEITRMERRGMLAGPLLYLMSRLAHAQAAAARFVATPPRRYRTGRRVMANTPILMYHSVAVDAAPGFRHWTISPSAFAKQMAYLVEQDYTPLTVSDFVDAVNGRRDMPAKPVLVTFDDGYADNHENALPVLTRFRIPATLYVATGFVGGTSRWLYREGEGDRRMLTWQQIAEMAAEGVECGAHSVSHGEMDTLSATAALREIVGAKEALEQHLGLPVRSFSYPHGYYTRKLQEQVRQAGFSSAVGVKHAMSSTMDDPYALARIIVGRATTEQDFAALLAGAGLRISPKRSVVRTAAWRTVRRARRMLRDRLPESTRVAV